jgi:hypothetical protein
MDIKHVSLHRPIENHFFFLLSLDFCNALIDDTSRAEAFSSKKKEIRVIGKRKSRNR